MSDWYGRMIEPEVRDLVRLLRENGVNTVSSCGHKRYVQCEFNPDGATKELDDLLCNHGLKNYTIEFLVRRVDGHAYNYVNIQIFNSPEEVIPATAPLSEEK